MILASTVPQPVQGPLSVVSLPEDATRLQVQWSSPSSNGGSALAGFEVEASRTPTFDGSCGDLDEV